jgi:hypothetical protein
MRVSISLGPSFIVNKIVPVQAVKARGERRNSSSHSVSGALECETSEQRRKKFAHDMLAETGVQTLYEKSGVCLVKNNT